MGFLSGISSFVTTGKYWLIALAVASAVAFAGGWYYGDTHAQKISATASATVTAGATAHGAKVQAAQNDHDAAVNTADSQKRSDANTKRDQTAAAIHDSIPQIVPATAPTVSAEAMSRLNDPALIGEDAQ